MKKSFMLAALFLSFAVSNAQNTAKNCYRGYVDAGYSVGIGDYDFGRFTSYTSLDYTRNSRLLDTEAITMKLGFEF